MSTKNVAILALVTLGLAVGGCRRSSSSSPPAPAPTTGGLVTGFGTGGIVTLNPTTGEDTASALATDGTSLFVIGHVEVTTGNFEWRIE